MPRVVLSVEEGMAVSVIFLFGGGLWGVVGFFWGEVAMGGNWMG